MSKRVQRLSRQVHQEVAELLHQKMRDPRLREVTVTRVEMSRDLHYAWVYVDLLQTQVEREEALRALEGAASFLRGLLGRRLRLRHAPELVFRLDRGLEHRERVHRLLEELRQRGQLPEERDGAGETEAEAAGERSAQLGGGGREPGDGGDAGIGSRC